MKTRIYATPAVKGLALLGTTTCMGKFPSHHREIITIHHRLTVQRQTAVIAHFSSKQLLLFAFEMPCRNTSQIILLIFVEGWNMSIVITAWIDVRLW